MTPRLKELYYKEIQPALKSQFGFKNLYMGPKNWKNCFKYGLRFRWKWLKNIKVLWGRFSKITGQKPVITNLKNQLQILKQEKGQMLV